MAPKRKKDDMLWSGRFTTSPHPRMLEMSASVDVDMRLLEFDLVATKAHARVLAHAELLGHADVEKIDAACETILREYWAGNLPPSPHDEDVHSFVERELTNLIGDTGARIHAGRSRNDLVAADLRLWCRDAALDLHRRATDFIAVLVERAVETNDAVMPGYTHLQRAQSVPIAFHFLAHGFAVARDLRRFENAWTGADVSCLGAGALAGTTLPLDATVGARFMGLGSLFDNAMDAVSDRDFASDLLYAATLCGTHLSRLAEEIILWTTSEFSFARISDEWSTGSSMMPHKRNPDLPELVRGRAAAGIGDLTGFLSLIKGLPLAYNRDLQEDKAPVFRTVDRVAGSLEGMMHIVENLELNVEEMSAAAANPGAWATELAEVLVTRGVPFRDAHTAIGNLVGRLENAGVSLSEAPPELLAGAHPRLKPQDASVASRDTGWKRRGSHGGTAPAAIGKQIESLRQVVVESRIWQVERGPAPDIPG
jgi:argininosuccinate lyase